MAQRKSPRRQRSAISGSQIKKKNPGDLTRPGHWRERLVSTDWQPFLSKTLPFLLLLIVTFLAYANAWPDNLVWDDTRFALTERFSGLGLADIGRFFTEDLWAVEGRSSGLYRPLLLLSVMLDVRLLGDWVSGYHLVNIGLHLLMTALLYGFMRELLPACGAQPASSRIAALLAALIFGVHPIHAEVVNSIFNRSEILVSIGVTGGLWWLLRNNENSPKMAWSGLSLIYLLVLFCRENGVVLPALAVTMLWLISPGGWRQRFRKCAPVVLLVIPLAVYLLARVGAMQTMAEAGPQGIPVVERTTQTAQSKGTSTGTGETQSELTVQKPNGPHGSPAVVKPVLSSKLVNVPASFHPDRLSAMVSMWADALRLTVWPHPLLLYHGAPRTGFWTACLIHFFLVGSALAGYFRKRPGPLVGLFFFYVAILPSSGLFGEEYSFELSERFLYLPSIGLAICLAALLARLAQRLNPRVVVLAVTITAAVLTPLTWARNSEWATNLGLAEADHNRGSNHFFVLSALVKGYLDGGEYARAAQICDLDPKITRSKRTLGNMCVTAYDLAGRFNEAEQLMLRFIRKGKAKSFMHFTLASVYLRHGRRSEAEQQFQRGIAVEQTPSHREFLTGVMLTRLHPRERARLLEARSHYLKAIELQPQFFQARQMLNELDRTLNR